MEVLAPEPSAPILTCSHVAVSGAWGLQSEEVTVWKELGSGPFGAVRLGRFKGQCDVLLR